MSVATLYLLWVQAAVVAAGISIAAATVHCLTGNGAFDISLLL